jgi:hypothetical protein
VKAQFDVWRFIFPKRGEHPVVLISHPDRCAHAEVVNVLYCTSQRQSRAPKPYEVMLNGADGMDWEALCDCSLMYSVPAAALFGRRGSVSAERRNSIREKSRDLFQLSLRD